jgi:hypothetical protein
MMRFEVYTRCGRGRRYHGTVPASSSQDAAWYWFAQHPSTKRVLVRPEDSRDKLFAYRRTSRAGMGEG